MINFLFNYKFEQKMVTCEQWVRTLKRIDELNNQKINLCIKEV